MGCSLPTDHGRLGLAPDPLLAHAGFVRRLARALVRDGDAAEDVVQDTWAAALAAPPRRAGDPRGWLATLAQNFARRRSRSDCRQKAREFRAARAEAQPSPAAMAERQETLRAVVDAVLALPEPYRGHRRTGHARGITVWRGLAPGRYLVTAMRSEDRTGKAECEVHAGRTTAVEVKLAR